jgi:hypothetical protein
MRAREADYLPPSSAEFGNEEAVTPLPDTSSWRGALFNEAGTTLLFTFIIQGKAVRHPDEGPSHTYQQRTKGPVTEQYPDDTTVTVFCQTLKLFQRFPPGGLRIVPKGFQY